MDIDEQPVRYVGTKVANTDAHDGQLRSVVGVQSRQVMRANRTHPELAENFGWTWNHSPMLAYWNGRFYLDYHSCPANEHGAPGQTFLVQSEDGLHWGKPVTAFPTYRVHDGLPEKTAGESYLAGGYADIHQRMAFYVAPNDRLLVIGFYGLVHHLQGNWTEIGEAVGRVVREAYADGSLGPIYFLRYAHYNGWSEENTRYPFYGKSEDAGFVEACDALLADKLVTLQWWEEDHGPDVSFAVEGYKAFCYYHLPDGRVVGLWKLRKAAISEDDGESWSEVADVPSLQYSMGKIWGQRTSDGRYSLVYNPTPDGSHRWPLAVVTSDDGINFDDLLIVSGEVPPRRFSGYAKDPGLNYVRGIVEGNGRPPDGAMWLTYSMNKEDIWVSRVPIPIRSKVDQAVNDTFNEMEPGGIVKDWNIYSPQWASVSVVADPGPEDKSLELDDREPYDYAKAERVFPESKSVRIRMRVLAKQSDTGQLHIEVLDHKGARPVQLLLDADGQIKARRGARFESLQRYRAGEWYEIEVALDVTTNRYDVIINGEESLLGGDFVAPVMSVERVLFRTGARRWEPTTDTPLEVMMDLPRADDPVDSARYYLSHLLTLDHELA